MEGGGTIRSPGDANYVLELMIGAIQEDTARQLELVACSMRSEEASGAHTVDVVRLLVDAKKLRANPKGSGYDS